MKSLSSGWKRYAVLMLLPVSLLVNGGCFLCSGISRITWEEMYGFSLVFVLIGVGTVVALVVLVGLLGGFGGGSASIFTPTFVTFSIRWLWQNERTAVVSLILSVITTTALRLTILSGKNFFPRSDEGHIATFLAILLPCFIAWEIILAILDPWPECHWQI